MKQILILSLIFCSAASAQMLTLVEPDTSSYASRVRREGSAISANNAGQADILVKRLRRDQVWNNMSEVYLLAGPDDLTGTTAKLKFVSTNTITFVNFVGGDYNRTNGLVGNASTKYGDLNYKPTLTVQNSHQAVYGPLLRAGDGTGGELYTMGSATASAVDAFATIENTGSGIGRFARFGRNPDYVSAITTQTNGLICATSISATDMRLFENTTQIAIQTSDRSSGLMPNFSIYIFAYNGNGTTQGPSGARLQIGTVGTGLSSNQVVYLNSAITNWTARLQ